MKTFDDRKKKNITKNIREKKNRLITTRYLPSSMSRRERNPACVSPLGRGKWAKSGEHCVAGVAQSAGENQSRGCQHSRMY